MVEADVSEVSYLFVLPKNIRHFAVSYENGFFVPYFRIISGFFVVDICIISVRIHYIGHAEIFDHSSKFRERWCLYNMHHIP